MILILPLSPLRSTPYESHNDYKDEDEGNDEVDEDLLVLTHTVNLGYVCEIGQR